MAAYLQIPHQAQYEGNILSQMFLFQNENFMTDFKILVNGKAIHCHRLVLAAACPYFVSLFNSGMNESLSGEVSMDTLNYESLYKVVQYMYGHDINVSLKFACDLFEICEILQFESLHKQLCLIVEENTTADNCIQFWKMAETYSLTEIASTAKRIMEEKFNVVARSDDFKNLTLAELLSYIGTAKISNRDSVLAGCFNWVNVDKAERQQSLVDILGNVQLDQCSFVALQEIYNQNKDIVSLEVAHMFVDALSHPDRTKIDRQLVVLGGIDKWEGTLNTRCWVKSDSFSNQWKEFVDIPIGYQAMHCPILCLPRGFVILGGGDDFRKNTMYDANRKIWIDLPPTPVSLCNTTAVLSRNEILLLGGELNEEVQNSVYSLDMTKMHWTKYPEMLEKQCFPIATTANNDIFVLYSNDDDCLSIKTPAPMQKYCHVKKRWSYLRSPPETCITQGAKIVTYNYNSLYCVGGPYRMCARYDINDDAWTLLTSQQGDYFYSTLFVMNKKIYIAGGNKTGKAFSDIEEYDVENDSWKVCSMTLPQPLTLFAMDMVDWL